MKNSFCCNCCHNLQVIITGKLSLPKTSPAQPPSPLHQPLQPSPHPHPAMIAPPEMYMAPAPRDHPQNVPYNYHQHIHRHPVVQYPTRPPYSPTAALIQHHQQPQAQVVHQQVHQQQHSPAPGPQAHLQQQQLRQGRVLLPDSPQLSPFHPQHPDNNNIQQQQQQQQQATESKPNPFEPRFDVRFKNLYIFSCNLFVNFSGRARGGVRV